jgi:probable HAF family extracellular repeat protein
MLRRFPAILLPLLIGIPASADIRYHLTDLGTFGGDWSQALGINNKGQVAGGASRPDGTRRAMIYDKGIMTDLGSVYGENGWSIAAAINERGQVGGQTQVGVDQWGRTYRAAYFENGTVRNIGDFGGWNGITGDLNLDGQVTIADFIQLSAHFDMSGPQLSWTNGDLNYDSAVTIADFIELAANFGSSSDLALLNDFVASHPINAVPEPAFLLAVVAFFSLRRRVRVERI